MEAAQVGVDGVDRGSEPSSDVRGVMASRVEKHGFQTPPLPRPQRLLQQRRDLTQFLRRWRTNAQLARHGFFPPSALLLHSNNLSVTNSYNLYVTPRLSSASDALFRPRRPGLR